MRKLPLKLMILSIMFVGSAYGGAEGIPKVPAKSVKTQSVALVEGSEILIRPGISVVAPIALGHLNRIVTPFENPQARTVSNAQIQVHGKVVYVATEEPRPITLFITPPEKESPALSLVLAPRQIPPREIILKLPRNIEREILHQASKKQVKGKDIPHVTNIKAIMKAVAKGKIPPGFFLRDPKISDKAGCLQHGLKATVGQVMEGPGLVLRVAVLKNTSTGEVKVKEDQCSAPGTTVAVATWPKVRLAPRDQVELYILSRETEVPAESVRPPLINMDGRS